MTNFPKSFDYWDRKFCEFLELLGLYLALSNIRTTFVTHQDFGYSINHLFAAGKNYSTDHIQQWNDRCLADNLVDAFKLYLSICPNLNITKYDHRLYQNHAMANSFGAILLRGLLDLEPSNPMTPEDYPFFEAHILPAVRRIIAHKHGCWLRHGFEDYYESFKGNYSTHTFTPDEKYPTFFKINIPPDMWAVEVGDLPFRDNMLLWKSPLGMLPTSILYSYNPKGKVAPCKLHFAAKGIVPLREWIFVIAEQIRPECWNPLPHSHGFISLKAANECVRISDTIVRHFQLLRCHKEIKLI